MTANPPAVGVAVVSRLFAFDPASGSVNAKQNRLRPETIPGSQRSCCSGVPCRADIVPAIAVEMISLRRGIAARREPLAGDAELEHAAATAVLLGKREPCQPARGELLPLCERRIVVVEAAVGVLRPDREGELRDRALLLCQAAKRRVGDGAHDRGEPIASQS